jgi:hypothetical protein
MAPSKNKEAADSEVDRPGMLRRLVVAGAALRLKQRLA